MTAKQTWIVLRLDDQDRILEVFEYDDMDDARESFDEEVQDFGHRASMLPLWLFRFYEGDSDETKDQY